MQAIAMLETIKDYGQADAWQLWWLTGKKSSQPGAPTGYILSGSHSSKTSSATRTSTCGIGASPSYPTTDQKTHQCSASA